MKREAYDTLMGFHADSVNPFREKAIPLDQVCLYLSGGQGLQCGSVIAQATYPCKLDSLLCVPDSNSKHSSLLKLCVRAQVFVDGEHSFSSQNIAPGLSAPLHMSAERFKGRFMHGLQLWP